jgi:protein farnesyltransferase subunit beta
MNLAPDTTTIEAQRNTELLLLDYLRNTNPHTYALWCSHPDYHNINDPDDEDEDDSTTSRSEATASSSSPSSKEGQNEAANANICAEAETIKEYEEARFHRAAHVKYASTGVQNLPTSLQGMYPSRPWIAYWCLQAADLLGAVESDLLSRTPADDISAFLHSCLSHDRTCEAELKAAEIAAAAAASTNTARTADFTDATARPTIGFAGGPVHQWPHLASSYAACCALATLASYDGGASLRRLPRAAIKRWLLTLRNDDGSFRVHGGGESDIRASYCAAVITSLLCLDDPSTFNPRRRPRASTDNDTENFTYDNAAVDTPREYVEDVQYEPVLTLQTAKFVAACQTHEGGFTCSSTASEAHGAYTQCGLAALILMKQPHLVHQASLRRWLAARQLNCEGGFNGRTNKLVDSCYSHWVGASHVLLRTVEAYRKCFTPVEKASEKAGATAEEIHGGSAASSAYLLAKEVVLLNHAQLLDAKLIQASETAAWDKAEAEHFNSVDLVDQFLTADDSCLREACAKHASVSALYDDIMVAHDKQAGGTSEAEKTDGLTERVQAFHRRQDFLYADVGDYYFNQRKLQDYVLRCCQDVKIGGLMDKPGTAHDAYHTCYSLSGMSAAQNLQYLAHATAATAAAGEVLVQGDAPSSSYISRAFAQSYLPKRSVTGSYGVVLSIPGTPAAEAAVLRTTSPIFNVHQSSVLAALRVWSLKSFL